MTRHPRTRRSVALFAIAAPAVLTTTLLAAVAAFEAAGAPRWGVVPQNPSEAAALGHAADLARFLEQRMDPARPYVVRGDVAGPRSFIATPIEAALVGAGSGDGQQEAIVSTLLARGAAGDAESQRLLRCLAADVNATAVIHLFSGYTSGCTPGSEIARLFGRTR